jgi:endonuclease/exonuclease/phosphatase family metal-dependent hydrolase
MVQSMKSLRLPALALLQTLILVGCSAQSGKAEDPVGAGTAPFRIGTFNIHYVVPGRERMEWEPRAEAAVAAVRALDADIVAFQEMETFTGGHVSTRNVQLQTMRQQFPGHSFGAVGNPEEYPWTQPVMYRSARFEQLDQGFFFFSPTPDRIYSEPWQESFPAFCSWVRLRDREAGRSLYVYNVHFDHRSLENRNKAAELVVERARAREHPEDAALVIGDTNSLWFFRSIRILEDAGFTLADPSGPTFHWNRGLDLLPAIDHLLVNDALRAGDAEVLRRKIDGVWPSDHYPVAFPVSYTDERG